MCLLPVHLHLPHLLLLPPPGVLQVLLLVPPLLQQLVLLELALDDPAGPLVLDGHDLLETHPMMPQEGLFSLATEVEDTFDATGCTLGHEALRVLRAEGALQEALGDCV